jgi:hypothetical protein
VTAYPAWTPAPRPGIIPLHPLGFGTILGRSFSALRQNPRVLLGFALGVQAIAYVLLGVIVAVVAFLSISRLDTVRFGSDEYDAILAGSVAITIIAAAVFGLLFTAVSVVVQGVVIAEVAHEAVAEKLRLAQLWKRVRPVFWRLIGYSLLILLAYGIVFTIFALIIVATAVSGSGSPGAVLGAFGLIVLFFLLGLPLFLWLSTKLLLVPAIIVIEHGRVMPSIARSWRLTRKRFWPTLGIIVVIAVTMGFLAQIVSLPFSFLSGALGSVFAPTGQSDPTGLIALVVGGIFTQILTLLIQAITIVVQATATTLIYIDCRMRKEGLDLDLLGYVEQRDAGYRDLPDPYLAHIGVDRPSPFVPQQYAPPAPGYPQGAYPAPQYGQQPSPAPQPYPGQQPYPAQQPYAAPPQPAAGQYPPPPPYGQPAPQHPAAPPYAAPAQYPAPPPQPEPGQTPPAAPVPPRTPDTSTDWAAPGAPNTDPSDQA